MSQLTTREARLRRHRRVRGKVRGTAERPRLAVFRSNRGIFAQLVDDEVAGVGVGYGKAREVPLAISTAVDDAKKNIFTVAKHGQTITHESLGRFDAARVLLRPASPGTGVIAGGGVRAVLELAGIRDVLAKSLGTTNPINMLKAAETAQHPLRRPEH